MRETLTMGHYSGAEVIVEYLIKEGVPYIFGLCGHGDIGLLDAVYDRNDRIKAITVRHEQAAGHMADAYFRVSHRPVATLTSCGPGTCNLPVALGSAFMDSSALLAITGNVPLSQFNRGPLQESYRHYQAEGPQVLRPYVKKIFQPTSVDMIPLAIRQAFKTMVTGRFGPVCLDVPNNLFMEKSEVDIPEPGDWRLGIDARSAGNPETIESALNLLLEARRPLMLAGYGTMLSEASEELTAFATFTGIPVITSPVGQGVMDEREAWCIGVGGDKGTYPANQASRNCDVLLSLGCRFCDRMSSSWLPGYTFSIPPTKHIQVDIDPEEIARNYPVEIGIVGDAKLVLKQLLHMAQSKLQKSRPGPQEWWSEINQWTQEWEDHISPHITSDAVPIRPDRLVHDMRQVMPEDAILLCDVGDHHGWMTKFWQAYKPQTQFQPFGFASMAFAVCGVLGAKLAAPDQPCVCLCGDGGFMMAPHIVSTAVEYDIPAVWVIFNNYGYNAIRNLQMFKFKGREIITSFYKEKSEELFNPDFAAMAQSMGAEGVRIEKPNDFTLAFDDAIRSERPYVIDVIIDRDVKLPSIGTTWDMPPLPVPDPVVFGEKRPLKRGGRSK
jgi:acetolactate synthase-1/2/3 large subunit